MFEVSERLLAVVDDVISKHGISQSELERRCGLSTVIPNVRNGKVMPSLVTVCKVLKTYHEYSPDWVLFGEGSMLRKDGIVASKDAEIQRLMKLNLRLQERLENEK